MGSLNKAALRVALIYASVSGLWILFSDRVVGLLPDGLESRLQTIKGLLFVLVTSLIIYGLVRRLLTQLLREAKHAESLERVLSQVVETVPVGVMLLNGDGLITFMNPTAESLLGVTSAESAGRRLDELGVMDNGAATLGSLFSTGALDGIRLLDQDGEKGRAVIVRAAEIDESLSGSGWVVAVADVTNAQEVRDKADRLLKGYQFLSDVAVPVARAGESGQVLSEVCRMAVERGDFTGVWAMMGSSADDGDPNASARFENVFRGLGGSTEAAAKLLMESYGPDGKMGSRLAEGEIVVFNDVANDPMSPWFAASGDDGFGSVGSLAIAGPSGAFLTLSLFARVPGYFTAEQVALMKTLRGTLGFAVDRIELDKRRIEAEDALEDSEAAYRSLFESNPEMMWVVDMETLLFLAVNEAAVARYGYTREEFLSMKVTEIRPEGEVSRFLEKLHTHIDNGFHDMGVWEHIDKSGSHFFVHARVNSIEWNHRRAELVMVTEQLPS